MNIIYLAHFAGSPEHGMVHAYYHLAREWLKLGHQVTIVAASHAHPRSVQPVTVGKVTEQWIDNIRFLWIQTSPYQAQHYLGRVKNIAQFVYRTWRNELPINSADLVICSSHHPFAIFPAHHLAKKLNARLVFEVRDLWPLSLIELGNISPKNPFIWLMQKAEDYAYRHAQHVVSVLSGAKPYMIEHGLDPRKYSYIPNGYAVSEQQQGSLPHRISDCLQKLKKDDPFILGYTGGINNGNALAPLIKGLAMIKHKPVVLLLLGDGPRVEELQDLAERLQVGDKVFFLGSVNKSVVQAFLRQVDAVYVGFQKREFYRYGVSPTKLNDYMYASKPVIYAIDAPDDPVSESGCGISCRAEDAGDLANAVQRLAKMSNAEREAMGKRGHEWLRENRDYAKLARHFLEEVFA
jgi:glycosyltransferase involved in cell wall biosynthesis